MPGIVARRILVGMMVLGACAVCGQTYPSKPIRILTPEIGGSADIVSRLIAQGISGPLGQPVIVENRGGGGTIAGEIVARATPDGYTLLITGGTFWLGPLLRKAPYDPVTDFLPITLTNGQPNVLVVHPSVAVRSVKELINLAKAKPGELNYASGSAGATNHLSGELFKAMAGVNIVRIPYKGPAAALNDLMGGQVQLMFPNAAAVAPHMKSGRLRALAVTSAEPSALVPGLPTVAASGLPGYESGTLTAMFAPAKTPVAIINRLNQEITRFLRTAEAKEKLLDSGIEAIGSSPEASADKIKSEIARMGKVIRDAGIKAE